MQSPIPTSTSPVVFYIYIYIHLDPRYHFLLTEEDKVHARFHLAKMWTKMEIRLSDVKSNDVVESKSDVSELERSDYEWELHFKAQEIFKKEERSG